ncbi:hypothetical protein CJ030_MR2G019398 [Morella rubra]|uniref:Uncharacterized protein n=1 Tax=Morella rubra TaxID=262757 RepID=A0A6A1WHR0_9ROSI|nr:hypothetical protein CJ030_MR2G019398 [Morella rubra]
MSYEGNEGLCGFPLTETCKEPRTPSPTFGEAPSGSKSVVNWNFLSVELGFVFGLGIVILPLVIWKRWRRRYYHYVDNIFFMMFPQWYLGREYRSRRVHRSRGRRH